MDAAFVSGYFGTELIGERLTNTAIIGTLGTGETAFWPLVWFVIDVEEGVFLLETEPWYEVFSLIHDLLSMVAVVGLVGGAIVVVAFSKHEDVLSATEGIFEDSSGAEVNI